MTLSPGAHNQSVVQSQTTQYRFSLCNPHQHCLLLCYYHVCTTPVLSSITSLFDILFLMQSESLTVKCSALHTLGAQEAETNHGDLFSAADLSFILPSIAVSSSFCPQHHLHHLHPPVISIWNKGVTK